MPIKKRVNAPARPKSLEAIRDAAERKRQQRDATNKLLRQQHAARDNIHIADLLRGLRGDPIPSAGYPSPRPIDPVFGPAGVAYREARRRSIVSPGTAIKALCASCRGGQTQDEADHRTAACDDTDCPLWPFRMGDNTLDRKK